MLYALILAGLPIGLLLLVVPIEGFLPAAPAGAGLLVLSLVGLAMIFAAAETAVPAIRRPRLQQLLEAGVGPARTLQRLLENSIAFLTTSQLIITAALVGATTVLAAAAGPVLAVALNSVVGAYLLLALAMLLVALALVQQIARALGVRHAETVALTTAGIARASVVVLSPLLKLLGAFGGLVYEQGGAAPRDTAGAVTEAGIMLQVDVAEEEGVLEEDEGEMIRSIFEFGDTVVREVMVPRIDAEAAEASQTLSEAVDLAVAVGHSRIPIYEDTIDRVVGIFYVKDALRFLREGRLDVKVREVMRPAYFVPETKKVDELLHEMQARRVHVAIVVDEYGGTAGLVTIEDILEEIVGEIQDEFDAEEARLHRISEHEVVADALITLDDLNDMLHTKLAAEDVDTLGGFMYANLGRVPERGDEIVVDGLRFIVEDVEGNRINKVRIIRSIEPIADGQSPGPPNPPGTANAPGQRRRAAEGE
ncbi:MAG: HlyC/CorC family transporter [Chloroflexi bacterium]|nr:HlyC/CorC family transporter [Chloroflexota bacterium]